MGDIISIKNLNFKYNEVLVLEKVNLNIKNGEWVTLVGPNNSGKTTLVKLLSGLLLVDDGITIDNMKLNKDNLTSIRKNMGAIFSNVDNQFVTETVRQEIAFSLENLAYDQGEIDFRINEIAINLRIDNILDSDPHNLSGGEKKKVALASVLVTNPKILIFDEAFSMIDNHERESILDLLKNINKDKGIGIINITHNLEEAYMGDRIIVLNKGKILMDGGIKEVLKKDTVFNRIGLEIPFMVDLSLKLNLYDLVDDIIFDMDEMVDLLWK